MKLPKNEIHVYWVNLDQSKEIVNRFFQLLSNNEVKKVLKYRITVLRNRQIVSQGILKTILSKYLEISTDQIEFNFNKFGKPSIADNYINLEFNISHSGNVGMFSFCIGSMIGIDVEKVQEDLIYDDITEICFTKYEKEWFNKFNMAERKNLFFKIWTAKEAFMKAIGKGFFFSPTNIEYDYTKSNELIIKAINERGIDEYNWNVFSFKPVPNIVSTLVYDGSYKRVVVRHCLPETGFHIERYSQNIPSIFN